MGEIQERLSDLQISANLSQSSQLQAKEEVAQDSSDFTAELQADIRGDTDSLAAVMGNFEPMKDEFENVRFETTQKHSRAVTRKIVPSTSSVARKLKLIG